MLSLPIFIILSKTEFILKTILLKIHICLLWNEAFLWIIQKPLYISKDLSFFFLLISYQKP